MRCACGYPQHYHDGETCPLCTGCGRVVDGHMTLPAAPTALGCVLPFWDPRTVAACPGRARTETGRVRAMTHGAFREPQPVLLYAWSGMLIPLTEAQIAEYERETAPAVDTTPRVPAREAEEYDEVAPAALRAGKAFRLAGWTVTQWFWIEHDGTEAFALRGVRAADKLCAIWKRKPGATWRTDLAVLATPGAWPKNVGIKALTALATSDTL